MYIVMRVYRDEYGTTQQRRWNMCAYKRDVTACKVADGVKGGYVCKMGSNSPEYVGAWQ